MKEACNLATHCHTHYHVHPFHFVKFRDLVAKQHPTRNNGVTITEQQNKITAIQHVQSMLVRMSCKPHPFTELQSLAGSCSMSMCLFGGFNLRVGHGSERLTNRTLLWATDSYWENDLHSEQAIQSTT